MRQIWLLSDKSTRETPISCHFLLSSQTQHKTQKKNEGVFQNCESNYFVCQLKKYFILQEIKEKCYSTSQKSCWLRPRVSRTPLDIKASRSLPIYSSWPLGSQPGELHLYMFYFRNLAQFLTNFVTKCRIFEFLLYSILHTLLIFGIFHPAHFIPSCTII